MIKRQPLNAAPPYDTAALHLDRLCALATLLSIEEVADQFTGLDVQEQVAIFGLFEMVAAAAHHALIS